MSPLTERFELRLDEDTLQEIEAWRVQQNDVPSRAEAIRRLVGKGLAAQAQVGPPRFDSGETLILHMLCNMFKAQKIKSDIDPKFVQSALGGGHLWGLQWEYPGIFHHHVDDPKVVNEVIDILDMWDLIEAGFANLGKKEKDRVAKEAAPFGSSPAFRGFDGNNEPMYCGVAKFLISDLARFSRFKGRDLNSHMPSVEMYRRMLKEFLPVRATLMGGELTDSQIIRVLNAKLHPERPKE